ncbi:hypothetical protein H9635_07445 [Solibacillus sp. A46]|uniref:Uncharacterized protein n=1 Tax=Solibacillus faecavium TaxID=2762221 RepID=A0ABR8XX93_9BACL|nr:hypothetical protein [Solibacillus faecavium]MBD8036572.1 hypothetical protein [Solibacillus faecavium]
MVTKYLDRYAISVSLLVLLLILSLVFTGFFTSNVMPYAFAATVLAGTSFFFEYLFNKAGNERQEKGKKMYFYVIPANMIIFVGIVLLLFN